MVENDKKEERINKIEVTCSKRGERIDNMKKDVDKLYELIDGMDKRINNLMYKQGLIIGGSVLLSNLIGWGILLFTTGVN